MAFKFTITMEVHQTNSRTTHKMQEKFSLFGESKIKFKKKNYFLRRLEGLDNLTLEKETFALCLHYLSCASLILFLHRISAIEFHDIWHTQHNEVV
jgi:hypothetical protein